MEIKNVIYEHDFRKLFPELANYFSNLDYLGGKDCKSCNRRKVRTIITTVSALISKNPVFSKRLKTYGQVELEVKPQSKKNYSTQITLDMYKKSIFLKEAKTFLLDNHKEEAKILYRIIDNEGYFSEKTENSIKKCYLEYCRNEVIKESFNKLLDDIGRNKLFHDNPKCKILEANTAVQLENKINEFLVGKKSTSISVEENKAVILYHLIK